MRTTTRRVAALVAGPTLALTLVATGQQASADPSPSGTSAATWLATQLTNGVIHYDDGSFQFDDYGLSADVGFAELEMGRADVAAQVRDAVAANLDEYIHGDSFGDPGSTYAGPTAKALVLAQRTGGNPTSFGGVNLVTTLESLVSSDPATTGRIQDVTTFSDSANTIGQTFAVEALTTASSPKSAAATAYLLKQQCPAGFFRLTFAAPDAPDQSCAAEAAPTPDTDVTAFAVLALQDQRATPAVATALRRAEAWLLAAQAVDGSFGGGDPTTASPNTNSTGLAARALGESCAVEAANRAASYVRSLQVPAGQTGPLAAEVGAIAYDAAARTAGQNDGITQATRDQWRRATAQAAPALNWDPAATATVELRAPKYVQVGDKALLRVTGAAAGERVCVTGNGVTKVLIGTGKILHTKVKVPAGTTKLRLSATTGPGADKARAKVLDKVRLRPKLTNVVHRGDRQVVRVTGLAKQEHVRLLLDGKRIAKGVASRKGVVVVRFRVGLKPGAHRVKVLGQFDNRRGGAWFRVVR